MVLKEVFGKGIREAPCPDVTPMVPKPGVAIVATFPMVNSGAAKCSTKQVPLDRAPAL